MAFPTISDADTQSGVQTSNSTSWTLTYPTNLATDDLIVAFVATDGNTAGTWPADWESAVAPGVGAVSILWAKKKSLGTETGNFTLTLSANEQGAWRIFRIPASTWEGTLGTNYGNTGASDGAVCAVSGTGASANPDPPDLNPVNWATEDTLWFAACALDTSRTISVYPLADRNTAGVSGGANGATLGLCTTISAVGNLDPGAFTISASDDWETVTVAVRPAAPAAPRVPRFTPYPQLLPR